MPKPPQRPLRIGDAPQPPRAIRRLAMHVTPEPGEWLQTAISRWAFDVYKCSRRDFLETIGMGALHPIEIQGLGVALRPETADTISAATGIPFARLYAMTQSMRDHATWSTFAEHMRDGDTFPYRERDLGNDPLFREVIHKWCPDCLKERPGVHEMIWRHPWLHICLKHPRILASKCSGCGEHPRIPLGRTAQEWDPNTCPNMVLGARCAEPFHQAVSPPVDEHGILYAAQVRIIALTRCHDPQQRERLYDLAYRIRTVQEKDDEALADLTGLDTSVVRNLQPRRLDAGHYLEHLETFTVLAAAAFVMQTKSEALRSLG